MEVVGMDRKEREVQPSVEYEPNDKSPLTDEIKVHGEIFATKGLFISRSQSKKIADI